MRARPLAWGLIAYGLLGLLLVIGGAVIGLDVGGRIERLASSADGTLTAAARSTRAAADSFASIDGSLSEAQASADGAAILARDAGATLDSLAVAMQLTFFGAQPLLPLADEFTASADQAEQLGGRLDAVGSSLGDTRTDVAIIGVELESLSSEIESLQGAGGADGGSPPLRVFVGLLLAWIAIPAVAALLVGLDLLRRRKPEPLVG
ncbi:MAG: hypothetical protein ABIP01_05900 [Candidatus Limnocylindria bacterium]